VYRARGGEGNEAVGRFQKGSFGEPGCSRSGVGGGGVLGERVCKHVLTCVVDPIYGRHVRSIKGIIEGSQGKGCRTNARKHLGKSDIGPIRKE